MIADIETHERSTEETNVGCQECTLLGISCEQGYPNPKKCPKYTTAVVAEEGPKPITYAQISRDTGNPDSGIPEISRSYVRNVLRGASRPSVDIALRLAAALNLRDSNGRPSVELLNKYIVDHQATAPGIDKPKHKLKVSDADVAAIRAEDSNAHVRDLAEKYGVSRQSISNIRRKDSHGKYVAYSWVE